MRVRIALIIMKNQMERLKACSEYVAQFHLRFNQLSEKVKFFYPQPTNNHKNVRRQSYKTILDFKKSKLVIKSLIVCYLNLGHKNIVV